MSYLENLDPSEMALVVIDMQKGFCSDTGGLARAGVNIERQKAIVNDVARLVANCRAAGIPILWSQQVHFEGDATRRQHRIPTHLDKRNLQLCYGGTEDVEFVEGLAASVTDTDHVFEKHRASCFFDTTLDTKLRMLGTRVTLIAGVNSNYCVDSTVRDAYFRDYDVIVVTDCIAGTFDDLHDAFLKNVELYFGELATLKQLEHSLNVGGR